MLLREIFEDDAPAPPGQPDAGDQPTLGHGGEMTEKLRQAALDYLTPLMGAGWPFVTTEQVAQALHHQNFGIVVTPATVMQLLNPNDVPAVSRIEGNRIYFKDAEEEQPDQEEKQKDEQKDRQQVQNMAQQQAQNSVKQDQQVNIPALGALNKA